MVIFQFAMLVITRGKIILEFWSTKASYYERHVQRQIDSISEPRQA